MQTIITIGDGVSAWGLHYQLRNKNIRIINIAAEEFYPSCSFRTTSINCLRGVRLGISELGDKLYNSYLKFEEALKEENFKGVDTGEEIQIWPHDKNDKWVKRYSDFESLFNSPYSQFFSRPEEYSCYSNTAYFIDPYEFAKNFKKYSNLEHIKGHVISIEPSQDRYQVRLSCGDMIVGDKVYICASLGALNLARGFHDRFDYYLDHSKPVAGTYGQIELDKIDLPRINKSFNLALESLHFIYRVEQNVLHIGSTTDNNTAIRLPNSQKLFEIYSKLQDELSINLPDFSKFNQICGIRFKGYKRKPFMGEISKNLYVSSGLYKNAFTLAFIPWTDDVDKI